MSNEIGNWRLGNHSDEIVTDSEIQKQTPDVTEYYGGFLVCESVATKRIARRIIASVRACKDIILEDLEQANSGYWVNKAKEEQAVRMWANEEIDRLTEVNAELLEALQILLKRVDKGSYPSQEEAQERQQARAAITRATGADKRFQTMSELIPLVKKEIERSRNEQAEPEHSPADDAQDEAHANQPTPYDP